ncbi:hypothetical protein [Streptomyces avicenniae]|nr:hypothetical protein [Streptomyces avicenniae]
MKKFALSLAAAFLVVAASSGIAAADEATESGTDVSPTGSVWD